MKRLIIICEGPTEVEFCKDVLFQHFLKKDIFIQTPLIKKSGGGIVPWNTLKAQIEKHLREGGAYVTSFIDYYGIPDKHQFPGWEESKAIVHKSARMDFLEGQMLSSISPNLQARYIPYLQLHEFEGLLFCDMDVFNQQISPSEFLNKLELQETIRDHPNPELINDNPQNAPSKRLQRLISGYSKPVYGSILAESIGLPKIREKCTRFNQWITKLESL